jgi:hypothetical protein
MPAPSADASTVSLTCTAFPEARPASAARACFSRPANRHEVVDGAPARRFQSLGAHHGVQGNALQNGAVDMTGLWPGPSPTITPRAFISQYGSITPDQ